MLATILAILPVPYFSGGRMEPLEVFDSLPAHIRSDPFMQFAKELAQATVSDRALVLVAHGFLEVLVNTVIDHKCKNPKKITSNRRDYPHSSKLLILNEAGLLSDELYGRLEVFRRLRNQAAHELRFKVDDRELLAVAGDDDYRKAAHPAHFACLAAVGDFWNSHFAVLSPVFSPGVLKGFAQPDKNTGDEPSGAGDV